MSEISKVVKQCFDFLVTYHLRYLGDIDEDTTLWLMRTAFGIAKKYDRPTNKITANQIFKVLNETPMYL